MQAGLVPRTLSWFEWGLLRTYLVKQNASRNIIKRSPQHKLQFTLKIYKIRYITMYITSIKKTRFEKFLKIIQR